jgi:hypothetical protein
MTDDKEKGPLELAKFAQEQEALQGSFLLYLYCVCNGMRAPARTSPMVQPATLSVTEL